MPPFVFVHVWAFTSCIDTFFKKGPRKRSGIDGPSGATYELVSSNDEQIAKNIQEIQGAFRIGAS